MQAAEVTPQGTGASGGVAVAARAHLGLARSPVAVEERHRSRVIVAWLGAGLRGGIHLVSVIFFRRKGSPNGTATCWRRSRGWSPRSVGPGSSEATSRWVLTSFVRAGG